MADNIKLLHGTETKMTSASAPTKVNGQIYFATCNDATIDRGYIYLDSGGKRFSFGKYAASADFATEAGFANMADLALKANASKNGVYYIEGDSSSTAGHWVGKDDSITEYYNGLTVAYKIPIAGGSSKTYLKINNLTEVEVVKNATTVVKSTEYPIKSIVILTYTKDDSTAYWKIADYNTDTNTKVSQYNTATDASYPLLFSYLATDSTSLPASGKSAANYARFNTTMSANPYTGVLSATEFHGTLVGNADSATEFKSPTTVTLTGDVTGTSDASTKGWTINTTGEQAKKWTTARDFTISDKNGTNTGAATSVDGSDAVDLKLPATIEADLSGNADSATELNFNKNTTTKYYLAGTTNTSTGIGIAYFDTGIYTSTTAGTLIAEGGFTAGKSNTDSSYKFAVGSGITGKTDGSVIFNTSSSKSFYFRPKGSTSATGIVLSTSTINPEENNKYDLGTSGLKFKDLYLAGDASIGDAITTGGNASIGGTLSVTGNGTFNADLSVGGALTVDQTAIIKRTLCVGGAQDSSHIEINANNVKAVSKEGTAAELSLSTGANAVATSSDIKVGKDVIIANAVTLQFNSTKKSLDFIFM